MGKPDVLDLKEMKHTNKKMKPAIDAELLAAEKAPGEAKEMAKDMFKGKEVAGVSEATTAAEAPKQRVADARAAVERSIRPEFDKKMREAAAEAVTKKGDKVKTTLKKAKLIDDVPIEQVYALLQKHDADKFKEITDREARKVEPYRSMSGDMYIDAGQILRNDLKDKFDSIQGVYDEVENEIAGKITGVLKKRHDATEALINARRQASELRAGDSACKVDLTALMSNPEGTTHAAKHLADIVGKTNTILSERTYRDPETKAYLREVSYAVDVVDPATGRPRRSDKEVVVEVWNVGKKGGNLLRSSLVKVDTVKGKEWQWKLGQGKWGLLPNRQEVDKPVGIMDRKFFRNRFRPQLSRGVREALDGVDSGLIENSNRDSSESGDMGGYAMTTRLGAHNAKALGYTDAQAKRVSKSPGILGMLSARLFSNSKKITKKG